MEDSGSVSSSFRRWALLSQWPVPLGQPHMLSLLTVIYPTSGFTTLYYPWPHPVTHGEDFPSRKPSNALKTTFVFNYARCGCSLAWKSWHSVCHGAGSRRLQWVEGRGSARGGAGKQRLWFWKYPGSREVRELQTAWLAKKLGVWALRHTSQLCEFGQLIHPPRACFLIERLGVQFSVEYWACKG